MADLTSKLADSIKKSVSGFGAGIKAAFMSANPAGFGLAMKGIQKALDSQVSVQRRDFEQRQLDRQFAEENSNEQRRLFTDILSVLEDIRDSLNVRPTNTTENNSGAGGFTSALAAIIAAIVSVFKGLIKGVRDYILFWNDALKLLKNGWAKILTFFDDLFKTLKDGPLGKFFSAIGTLFDDLLKIIKDGPIGKFFRAIGTLFDDLIKIVKDGPIGRFFAAIGTYFDNLIKMIKESSVGKFFAAVGTYFDDLIKAFREGGVSQLFSKLFGSISEFFGGIAKGLKEGPIGRFATDIGKYFDDILRGLQESSVGKFFGTMGDMLKDKWNRFLLVFDEIGFIFKEKFPSLSEALSKFKASIASIFTIVDDVSGEAKGGSIFDDIVKGFNSTMDFFKGIFGFFGKIGSILGDVTGLTKLFEGMLELVKGFMSKLKWLANIPFLAQIISAIEGIMEAFDTESLAESLNKSAKDINFMDRISGFLGGFIGSFIGGVGDFISMVVGWVVKFFGGAWEEKEGEDSYQKKMTRYFTSFFGGVFEMIGSFFSAIKGFVTGDSNLVKSSIRNMSLLIDDFITGLLNGVASIVNSLAGTFFDLVGKIPGMADKAAEWKEKLSMNANRVSERQVELTAAKAASANFNPETMGAYRGKRNDTPDLSGNKTLGSNSLTSTNVQPNVSVDYSGKLSNLTPQQTAMAEKIYSGFIGAGFSDIQAQAAIVNAYAESRLNPNAGNVTSKEASFGLFQLNTKGGLGKGYSPEYLKDPDNNIALIIREAKGEFGFGKGFRSATTLSEATNTFAQEIERPANKEVTGANRAAMATNSASVLSQFSKRQPLLSSSANENFRNYERSNVNSPTDAPKGIASDPVIVAPGAVDPIQKSLQKNVNDVTLKTPELSKEQLDEMKKQQAYREKIDAENKKYRDERDNLEKQFRATLENSIKDKLTAAIPMGVTGSAATTNAGGNIANKFLAGPMENLATKIFGKQTGKGVGQIFTQLAGSYGNQLIGNMLAPAFGMSSEQMNRSLNNFASGNKGAGWSDLLYGMTGIPTDLRTAFGYEDGISNFSKSLADITATPFSPLFKMDTSTSGVSAAEVSSTNAGIIEQNAAIQNAKIQIAGSTSAAQEFIKGVSQAAQNFGNSVTGGPGTDNRGILEKTWDFFTGGGEKSSPGMSSGDYEFYGSYGSASYEDPYFKNNPDLATELYGTISDATEKVGTFGDTLGNVFGQKLPGFDVSSDLIGGGTKVSSYFNSVTGKFEPFGTTFSAMDPTKDIGLLGRFGNMLSGGKAKNPINAGADFITGLAGSFIGSKLGIPTNTFGGSVAQTGINAIIKSLIMPGSPGIMASLAGAAPSMLVGTGLSKVASTLGSQTLMDFSGGLSGSAFGASTAAENVALQFGTEGATAAGQLGAVAGAVGAAATAYAITNALSGGYSTGENDLINAAVMIASYFDPTGGFIAGTVGAAVNRLFGRKAAELAGIGIEGTVGASKEAGGSGTSLQGWKNMYEKGGTYRTDRNTPSTFAIDPEVAAALMEDVDSSLTSMKTATSMLGLTSDKKFEDFTKAIKLDFHNKSIEEQQKMLVETLTTFNNEMLNSVFPTFKNFAMAGEKPIDVMNRLASSLGNVNAASMMLGYGDNFATAAGALAGDYANSVLSSGFNMEALRAQGIASGKVSNADYYGGIAELLTPASVSAGYIDYIYGNANEGGVNSEDRYVQTSAAKEAVYRIVSSDPNTILQSSRNADALLQADAANTIVQAFGGNTAFQTATTRYFDAFYTDKEKNAVRLKLARQELDRISKDVGGSTGTPLTDVTAGTKAQDKIDEYRAKTDAAYSTYLANPTADNLNKWKTLVLNAESYKSSVTTSIAAQKYEANPIDAAAKNASLQASLNALSTSGSAVGAPVSAAQLAGSTTLGASALTGYAVSPNIAQIMGGKGTNAVVAVPIYGGIVPGNNSASASSVVTSQGAGTLFAPTTYVDNSSVTSTNVNGSTGGGDNVRDTYSHPILGSTERSISSTYNYNFLYR